MIEGKGCGCNAAVPARLCSAEKEALPLPGLAAGKEDLAVDLRLVAALDDERERG